MMRSFENAEYLDMINFSIFRFFFFSFFFYLRDAILERP